MQLGFHPRFGTQERVISVTLYTEKLLDGAIMMGDCIKRFKGDANVYNTSNGLYINNTTSKLSEYRKSLSDKIDHHRFKLLMISGQNFQF